MHKFLRTTSGYEVLSNKGDIKIILQQTTVLAGAMETTLYTAHYYIKEGTDWLKTNTTHIYDTERDFISSLKQSDAFSQALSELKELLSEELSGDRLHGESYPCHYADGR